MARFQGRWAGLLAAALLACCATSQVIDFQMTTKHDFEEYMVVTNPKIEFKEGKPLAATIESGKTGQPVKIGIAINDSEHYQTMTNVGGSITDAGAIVLGDLRKASPEKYCEVLNMLYSQKEEWLSKGGAGLTFVRHPLGCSDFSVEYYTLDDPQQCGAEFTDDLKYFNLKGSSPKMWQVLKDIKEILESGDDMGNKRHLSTRTLPWTLNPAVKEVQSFTGLAPSQLLPQYEDYYVKYMTRAIKELCEIDLCPDWLSLVESIMYKDPTVPVMQMKYEQAASLAKKLANIIATDPEIKGFYKDLPQLKLLALEASWGEEDIAYAEKLFDLAADDFKGIGFKGYTKYDASPQEVLAQKYPGHEILYTEDAYTLGDPWSNLRDKVFNVAIQAIHYGTNDVDIWQNVLRFNEKRNETLPSLPGACKNCLANLIISEEALDGLSSQSQRGYCKASEPKADWVGIADAMFQGDNAKLSKLLEAAPTQLNELGEPLVDVKATLTSLGPAGLTPQSNLEALPNAKTNAEPLTKRSLLRKLFRRQDADELQNALPGDPKKMLTTSKAQQQGVNHAGNAEDPGDHPTGTVLKDLPVRPGGAIEPEKCFELRNMKFNYEPANCSKMRAPDKMKGGKFGYGAGGFYTRTSQMDFSGHLSHATIGRNGLSNAVRIGINSTDTKPGDKVINGRLIGTAFEQEILEETGMSRFSVLLLQWNDHDMKNFEEVTASISFRGKVAEITLAPGLYTLSWKAPTSVPAAVPGEANGIDGVKAKEGVKVTNGVEATGENAKGLPVDIGPGIDLVFKQNLDEAPTKPVPANQIPANHPPVKQLPVN